MTASLDAPNRLGIDFHSNIPAVLSESVAKEYEQMIVSMERTYVDLLQGSQKVSRIVELVDKLTESLKPSEPAADSVVRP